MRQIIVFKTLDELHAYAEKFNSHIRFEFESDDLISVKMRNRPITRLRYNSVAFLPDEPETHIIKGSNIAKFDFLFDHIDLLDQLATSEDVKEIDVRPVSIFFIYKENYFVYYSCHATPALVITKEGESYFNSRFAKLTQTSEVFEILDENIKDF